MSGAPGTIPQREPVAEFESLGVRAFTTTRASGDFGLATSDVAGANAARWSALAESLDESQPGLVSAAQVHGVAIAHHDTPWTGWRQIHGFDAHVVTAHGAAAITVADCVPVFIGHPDGPVAIVHAGWRGTAGRLLAAVIDVLASRSFAAADLRVHLGPAVCGRCYEVGPDVYEELTGWQTTRHRHVDLRALLAEQARGAGVRHVSASPWCTRCDGDRFFSHRGGDAARQIAVIIARAV